MGTQGFYVDWRNKYLITVCHASETTHMDVPMAHHTSHSRAMNTVFLDELHFLGATRDAGIWIWTIRLPLRPISNLLLISKSCCLSCRFKCLNFQPLSSLISGNFVTSIATTTVLHAWLNFLSNTTFDGITHLVCSGACLWSIWNDDLNYKTSLHF